MSERVTATFSAFVAPVGCTIVVCADDATTATAILKAWLTLELVEMSLTVSWCDFVRSRLGEQLLLSTPPVPGLLEFPLLMHSNSNTVSCAANTS